MDKRTSMGVIGDLSNYMQFQAAESLDRDGAGAAAMQTGMGAGLGLQMAQNIGQQAGPPWGGTRPAQAASQPAQSAAPAAMAPPPPPPPVEHVWHIAEGGETKGPFSKASMGRMAADGTLTRTTHVWTPGQDGWKTAAEVAELAQLSLSCPPPPPGA